MNNHTKQGNLSKFAVFINVDWKGKTRSGKMAPLLKREAHNQKEKTKPTIWLDRKCPILTATYKVTVTSKNFICKFANSLMYCVNI